MKDRVVAARYARAYFEAARTAKAEEKAHADLKRFAQKLRMDESLLRALEHPLLPLAEKKRRALAAIGKAESPLFERFLGLVLVKKRLSFLPYMAALFEELLDEAQQVRKVSVKSAAPLGREQVSELEASLAKAWGGRVVAEASVDESLLGGLVIRLGDKVWDRSLRTQLRKMKERLLTSTNV